MSGARWFARHPRQWVRWRWCELRAWLDAGPWLTAPDDFERCIMGYPLGIQCRRPVRYHGGIAGLWCDKHKPEGDWIIRGVQGEFYPCKPDVFDATYYPAGGDL